MVRPGGEFSLLQASSPPGQELARKQESASPSLGPVLAASCVHPTHLILKCCPNPLRLLGAFLEGSSAAALVEQPRCCPRSLLRAFLEGRSHKGSGGAGVPKEPGWVSSCSPYTTSRVPGWGLSPATRCPL